MTRPVATLLVVLAAVALVASVAGPGAAAAGTAQVNNSTETPTATETATASPTPTPTATETPTPSSSPSSSSDYTLGELRNPGRQLDNAPSSVRLDQDAGLLMWLHYVPAGTLSEGYSRQAARFTTRSTVVKQNRVWLRSNLVNVPESATNMTATVVAYRVASDQNGTQYATNVSVTKQQVSLRPGFSRSEIRLPKVNGEAKRVTIWLDTEEGSRVATWQFRHRSAATTKAMPLPDSAGMGALVGWGFANIGLPTLAGALGGLLIGFAMIKRARKGPGVTGVAWVFVAMPFGVLVLAMLYFNLIELFVTNPLLLALPSLGLVTVVTILYSPGSNVEKGLLLRPNLSEVTAPSGDEGRDFDVARDEVVSLVDTPDGGKAIVKDGWLAFFARIYGGLAVIENWHEARALTRMPNSTHDWLHIVSTESGEHHTERLYGYERPGLTVSLPSSWRGIVWRALITLSAGLIGWGLYPGSSVTLGLLTGGAVGLLLVLDGTPGWAYIPWGTKHHRTAYATAQKLAQEMDAADSAAESEKKRMQQAAKIERRAREKMGDYEGAYLSEMFGTGDNLSEVVDEDQESTASEEVIAAYESGEIDGEQAAEMLAARRNGASETAREGEQ
jgi:hypothetical protein